MKIFLDCRTIRSCNLRSSFRHHRHFMALSKITATEEWFTVSRISHQGGQQRACQLWRNREAHSFFVVLIRLELTESCISLWKIWTAQCSLCSVGRRQHFTQVLWKSRGLVWWWSSCSVIEQKSLLVLMSVFAAQIIYMFCRNTML
jgi:hypothetical protein